MLLLLRQATRYNAIRRGTRLQQQAKTVFLIAGSSRSYSSREKLIDTFRSELTSRPPTVEFDTIAPSQAQLLLMTLHPNAFDNNLQAAAEQQKQQFDEDLDDVVEIGRTSQSSSPPVGSASLHLGTEPVTKLPRIGTPLPPGYHMAYFPPRIPEHLLAPDGYDKGASPPEPFVQRMWAGADVTWDQSNPLRVGDECTLTTSVKDVQLKKSSSGEEMVIVNIQKDLANDEGTCMTELRNYVYLHRSDPNAPKERKIIKPDDKADFSRTINPTPVMLFRFSALTFNAHLIHYNHPYAVGTEGHKDIVVHGPMNFVLLLELLRLNVRKPIKRFTYRAMSPLYSGTKYVIRGTQDGKVWAETPTGGLAMKGQAEFA